METQTVEDEDSPSEDETSPEEDDQEQEQPKRTTKVKNKKKVPKYEKCFHIRILIETILYRNENIYKNILAKLITCCVARHYSMPHQARIIP